MSNSSANLLFQLANNNYPSINNLCSLAGQLKNQLEEKDEHDNTILHVVILNQKIKAVECLLNIGASTDAINLEGNTALHLAAKQDNYEIVKLLIEKKANPLALNFEKLYPVNLAPTNSFIKTYLYRIMTPFVLQQVYNGNVDFIKFAISKGIQINLSYDDGNTALHYATIKEDKGMVRYILKNGIDINKRNIYKQTALIIATSKGNTEIVKLLVDSKFELNYVDKYNFTALDYALNGEGVNYREITNILIDNGANPFIQESVTPSIFYKICYRGYTEAAKKILKVSKKDLNIQYSDFKQTPLHGAAINCNIDTVKLIVEEGADIFIKNFNGSTPEKTAQEHECKDIVSFLASTSVKLYSALINNSVAVFKRLFKLSYSQIKINNNKYDLLKLAVTHKNHEITKFMLEKGAKIEIDFFGETALHRAAWNKDCEMMNILIDHGANLRQANLIGIMPINIDHSCILDKAVALDSL